MELKPRYKQTETGVIPVDWDCVHIGDVAETSSGATPPRAKQQEYFDGGTIPWVKTLDLNNSSILETDECVTPSALQQTSLRLYPSGSVLVAMYGGFNQIGRTGILTKDATINQALTAIRPDQSRLSPRFLLNYLNFRVEYWKSVASSSRKDPNITGRDVREFPIPLPPLIEQEAAGEALQDIQDQILMLNELIAKKRGLKQAVMQELLTGKRRLPGFEGEWEVKRLGDFAECTSGGTPTTGVSAYWGGPIRWMSSGELHLKRVTEVSGRITPAGLENSSAKLLPPRCVLVGLAGQGKTRGTAAMNLVELSTNQSIAAVLPNSSFIPEYLYHSLDARYEELRELSSGSGGRGGLNLSLIKSLHLPMPIPEEQAAISTTLSDMELELNKVESKITKMRELKQGMLQQLLTGKIRLQ